MSKIVASEPSVGLFATCLVDLGRPSVGFAAAKLLENAGCRVTVPFAQSCCGQPAYNSGDNMGARAIAKKVIKAFGGFDCQRAQSATKSRSQQYCTHQLSSIVNSSAFNGVFPTRPT